MAIRQRVDELQMQPNVVSLSQHITETKFYHAICSRDPVVSTTEPEVVLSHDVTSTYSSMTEWIEDFNNKKSSIPPRIRPMGYCHHVRAFTNLGTSALRMSAQIDADPVERDYEGCDISQWIREERSTEETLLIRSDELALSCISSSLAGGSDPYLLINHFSFREKLADLDQEALKKVISSLDDGFSMPVFLFELIELKALWKHMNMLGTFSGLINVIRRLMNRQSTLRELSNHFLATIFGWAPFVRDVQTIISKFYSVAQKVEDFVEMQNKRRTLHVQKMLSPETFRPSEWFEESLGSFEVNSTEPQSSFLFANDLFWVVSWENKFSREVQNCSYHLTIDYQYDLPGVSPAVQSFMAELDHWGINLSVSDIWQVIPFSFCVDWCLNIGAWLEQFDFVNCPPAVVIHDCCRSIRYDLTEKTEFHRLTDLIGPSAICSVPIESVQVSPVSLSASVKTEGYYREPGPPLPAKEDLPNFRTPKGLQWVIASALLCQRR